MFYSLECNDSQPFVLMLSLDECLIILVWAGERQANINIADGRKSSVILASEAAMMDQVNRAKGMPCFCL